MRAYLIGFFQWLQVFSATLVYYSELKSFTIYIFTNLSSRLGRVSTFRVEYIDFVDVTSLFIYLIIKRLCEEICRQFNS